MATLFENNMDLEQPDMFMKSPDLDGDYLRRYEIRDLIITKEVYPIRNNHNLVWGEIFYSAYFDDGVTRESQITLVNNDEFPDGMMVSFPSIKFSEERFQSPVIFPVSLDLSDYLGRPISTSLLDYIEERLEHGMWSDTMGVPSDVRETITDAVWRGVVEYIRWRNDNI